MQIWNCISVICLPKVFFCYPWKAPKRGILEPRWLFTPVLGHLIIYISIYTNRSKKALLLLFFHVFIGFWNVQQKKDSSKCGWKYTMVESYLFKWNHPQIWVARIHVYHTSPAGITPPPKKKTNEFSVCGSVFSWIWNPFSGRAPKEWFLKTWISGPSDTALKWFTSWWFQPRWRILVKLDHFPR